MVNTLPRTASSIRSGCLSGFATNPRAWWSTSSDLYFRVDALLRELSNPNLHYIANMQNRVELWNADGQHIRWVVAATANITIGHAAFDAAVANWPKKRFTLRQGTLVIRQTPER
jgi:hypothetical protein